MPLGGQRLFERRPFGLFFKSEARLPQASIPTYTTDGSKQYVIHSEPTPYVTSQNEARSYVSFSTYEISNASLVRQYIIHSEPYPVYVNDTGVSEYIVSTTFKVTGSRNPGAPPDVPETPDPTGQIELWGDESGDLLLWGDQSGQLLLWGDTPT